MKILYIGHMRDQSGWGDAAINNILALQSAGVNVVARCISYNDQEGELLPRIEELEKKSSSGCDICIQHTLPQNYVYNSNFKNIGFIATECSDFNDTTWRKSLNMMDEIWVPSDYVARACFSSGVIKPIKIAPHSLNITNYVSIDNGPKVEQLFGHFTFGFVGEFIERKNLKALLRAFHTEFHPSENVNLFIKTSGAPLEEIQGYCKAVQRGLKLRANYKEEIILLGKIPKQDYISVLDQCDCLVVPSRGEGFCIPALEAMALGIPTIYTEGIALEEFCIGTSVPSRNESCFGATDSLSNLYTSNSTWKEINIKDLQIAMRGMFLKRNDMAAIKRECKTQAQKYSHAEVGQLLKGLLNDS